MKRYFFLILMIGLSTLQVLAQKDYQKNDHVSLEVNTRNNDYVIDYQFKDHWGNMQNFHLQYNKEQTDDMIGKFGIPKSMFERFIVTPETIKKRDRILKEGLFKKEGNYLNIDYSAVVNYYAPVVCQPIANLIIDRLQNLDKDSRKNRIELAMKFVQDIPYGVPDIDKQRIYRGGLHVPSEIFLKGYGDCDSKSLLFTGILSYLINPDDVILFRLPDHVAPFVRGNVTSGSSYLNLKGKTYLIAETAGPGRPNLGISRENQKITGEVHEITFNPNMFYSSSELTAFKNISKSNSFVASTEKGVYKLFFVNNTKEDIYVLLYVQDKSEEWETKAWYKLKPGEKAYLADTPNTSFYYYATSKSKSYYWGGHDHFIKFDNEKYGLKKNTIHENEFVDFTLHLG
ncbi:DUF1036 domain-containing protein [Chondrinema litorale]|uniref:DUF1036 domain-containing protein n=1 Tax=Chondrinema litorale TaxID=2994555 RepID=UPI002543AB25|nr:DUF1036 domain-containing protein [Chondrinema litorale]UZR99057.1 DUF1036 domain-containing protein [Chondrinema litorale]